jgi:predicted nucleic acid-binding protein
MDRLSARAGRPAACAAPAPCLRREPIAVGDLIILEILQGAPSEEQATGTESLLRAFIVARMLDDTLAVWAACNDRVLRAHSITIRKSIDLVIGTYCLEHGLPLLHADRDFDRMEQHLGPAIIAH